MRVGSDLSSEFKQVKHKYPMLSLANTYSENDVSEFYERVKGLLGGEDFEICCELKFDGTSISLTYEQGRLIQAVTRGDGEQGDDVTNNVKTIHVRACKKSGNYITQYQRLFQLFKNKCHQCSHYKYQS